MKNVSFFYLKMFSFLEVKFSIYLNRRVFVLLLTIANVNITNILH